MTDEDLKITGPILAHKVQITAREPTPNGNGFVLSGQIIMVNANPSGGRLIGKVAATHPAVTVRPKTFEGNGSRVSFWVDQSKLPKEEEVYVVIRTRQDERRIAISELFQNFEHPPWLPSWDYAPYALWMPALLATILLSLIIWIAGSAAETALRSVLGTAWPEINLAKEAPQALVQALYHGQWIGWSFLLTAWAVPIGVYQIFKLYPRHIQESILNHFYTALFSMSIVNFFMLLFPLFRHPITSTKAVYTCDLLRLYWHWYLLFNFLTALYCFLDYHGYIEMWFPGKIWKWIIIASLWLFYINGITLALSTS